MAHKEAGGRTARSPIIHGLDPQNLINSYQLLTKLEMHPPVQSDDKNSPNPAPVAREKTHSVERRHESWLGFGLVTTGGFPGVTPPLRPFFRFFRRNFRRDLGSTKTVHGSWVPTELFWKGKGGRDTECCGDIDMPFERHSRL